MLDFRFNFNSDSNIFYPGTDISGSVILNTEKELKARKIYFQVLGRAKTYWTVSHRRYTVPYGCQKDYMDQNVTLWESLDDSNQLRPGQYSFPFTIKIPANAPGTFKDKYGFVRYSIEAKIDIPMHFDKSVTCDFIVLNVLDLNIDRVLSLQASAEATENIAQCFSCTKYRICLKVSIPKTGYIPGETILLSVKITNKSSSKIISIECGFINDQICLGNRRYQPLYPNENSFSVKKWTKTQCEKLFKPPLNDDTCVYSITVPNLSPSYLRCTFIRSLYLFYIKVHTNATFSSGPMIEIPITIGTVAIQENVDETSAAKENDEISSAKTDISKNVDSGLKSDKNISGCSTNTIKNV